MNYKEYSKIVMDDINYPWQFVETSNYQGLTIWEKMPNSPYMTREKRVSAHISKIHNYKKDCNYWRVNFHHALWDGKTNYIKSINFKTKKLAFIISHCLLFIYANMPKYQKSGLEEHRAKIDKLINN